MPTAKRSRSKKKHDSKKHKHIFPPKKITRPCESFFKSHSELINFIAFIGTLTDHIDEGRKVAAKALYDYTSDEEEKKQYKEAMESSKGAQYVFLKSHKILLVELMLCRAVDNYLTYLAELMALIFRTKPETLKSGETIRLDEILNHESMAVLIDVLAERKVDRLSYQGMRQLSNYYSEHFGCILFETSSQLESAVRIVEMRNITVHNRGIVNSTFLSRVPSATEKLGDRISLPGALIIDYMEILAKSALTLDARARKKFKLPLHTTAE